MIMIGSEIEKRLAKIVISATHAGGNSAALHSRR